MTVAPSLEGNVQTGDELTIDVGEWKEPSLTYSYQWYRSDAPVGTNAPTYEVLEEDLGHELRVAVTGTIGPRKLTVFSNRTGRVQLDETRLGPVNLSGVPKVGESLTLDPGVWPDQLSLTAEWCVDGLSALF